MSSESNLYSVFGGEFVASKHGKPLGRERCGYLLRCFYFVITFFYFFYFISFALKNTKKKKNTEDMQTLVIRT